MVQNTKKECKSFDKKRNNIPDFANPLIDSDSDGGKDLLGGRLTTTMVGLDGMRSKTQAPNLKGSSSHIPLQLSPVRQPKASTIIKSNENNLSDNSNINIHLA